MTVLVTGATGMFGAGVANALCLDGVDVLAMTRSKSSAEELTRGKITGVVGDLDDPDRQLGTVRVRRDCYITGGLQLFKYINREGEKLY